MRAAKVDDNHAEVVSGLRAVGCLVQSLAMVGGGCPDILVRCQGQLWLFEIKDPSKPKSSQKLTPAQVKWHREWKGAVRIIHSAMEGMEIMGILR